MSTKRTLPLEQFEHLFQAQYASLFSLGFSISHDRELTKDVIQSVFLKMWEKRSQLSHVENLPAYLRKSLTREMIHTLRTNQRRNIRQQKEGQQNVVASPETLLIDAQEIERRDQEVQKAVFQLPEQQQLMLRMRFQEGLSYDQIATQTGKSKQTVYNQIYAAIKKLKQSLLLGLVMLFCA